MLDPVHFYPDGGQIDEDGGMSIDECERFELVRNGTQPLHNELYFVALKRSSFQNDEVFKLR